MTQIVTIQTGMYRNKPIKNVQFTVVKPLVDTPKGAVITVDGSTATRDGHWPQKPFKVIVTKFKLSGEPDVDQTVHVDDLPIEESDDEARARIRERFMILGEMTEAVSAGIVKGMVVSGPAGIGKTYKIEEVLKTNNLFNDISEQKPNFEIMKGASSALGLYKKLFEYSKEGHVL